MFKGLAGCRAVRPGGPCYWMVTVSISQMHFPPTVGTNQAGRKPSRWTSSGLHHCRTFVSIQFIALSKEENRRRPDSVWDSIQVPQIVHEM